MSFPRDISTTGRVIPGSGVTEQQRLQAAQMRGRVYSDRIIPTETPIPRTPGGLAVVAPVGTAAQQLRGRVDVAAPMAPPLETRGRGMQVVAPIATATFGTLTTVTRTTSEGKVIPGQGRR